MDAASQLFSDLLASVLFVQRCVPVIGCAAPGQAVPGGAGWGSFKSLRRASSRLPSTATEEEEEAAEADDDDEDEAEEERVPKFDPAPAGRVSRSVPPLNEGLNRNNHTFR